MASRSEDLQHSFDARREGEMSGDVGVLVDGDHLADGLNDAVVADVQAVEAWAGKTVLRMSAEQDMLGAHVGLVKRARLILSQDKHFARLVREFLE